MRDCQSVREAPLRSKYTSLLACWIELHPILSTRITVLVLEVLSTAYGTSWRRACRTKYTVHRTTTQETFFKESHKLLDERLNVVFATEKSNCLNHMVKAMKMTKTYWFSRAGDDVLVCCSCAVITGSKIQQFSVPLRFSVSPCVWVGSLVLRIFHVHNGGWYPSPGMVPIGFAVDGMASPLGAVAGPPPAPRLPECFSGLSPRTASLYLLK